MYECTVSTWPLLIPNLSFNALSVGVIALVVQLAAHTILSSGLINVPPTGMSSYIANKAYLEKLTKTWAAENSKFNITSNSISPSFMKTALTEDFDERVVEQMVLNHPNKKLITPKEVAETVQFLTNAGNHINGVDILMNAGVNLK